MFDVRKSASQVDVRLRLVFEFYLQVWASQQRIPGGAKRYLAVKTRWQLVDEIARNFVINSILGIRPKKIPPHQISSKNFKHIIWIYPPPSNSHHQGYHRLWGSQFQNLGIRFRCKIWSYKSNAAKVACDAWMEKTRKDSADQEAPQNCSKTSMHIYLPSSYSNLVHIFSHTFGSS